ncbi:hypothetical protein OF83DRAFT_1096993 [Amylostereum chailletii]|nr:hypothetical protein OF83DRAFT_1096993 [Amylostereum chailletii]
MLETRNVLDTADLRLLFYLGFSRANCWIDFSSLDPLPLVAFIAVMSMMSIRASGSSEFPPSIPFSATSRPSLHGTRRAFGL